VPKSTAPTALEEAEREGETASLPDRGPGRETPRALECPITNLSAARDTGNSTVLSAWKTTSRPDVGMQATPRFWEQSIVLVLRSGPGAF
jgi:hypothetical protein